MGEKLVVGPINRGLRTDRVPFVIDNDSFPVLLNAYQWRGRVKRKRGTSILGRLNQTIGTTDGSGDATITISPHPIASGISEFMVGSDIFTDPGGSSPVTLITNSAGSATLNRSTGVLTIVGSQISTPVLYYPGLPVLGLEDLVLSAAAFAGTLAFNTTYAYNISGVQPYPIYSVSYYKNPPSATINGKTYTAKATWTQATWTGQNYQQFWSTNYQGAFWVTNTAGSTNASTTAGMQFQLLTSITYVSATQLTLVVPTNTNLVQGDWIWINEVTGTNSVRINQQTGFIDSAPVTGGGTTTFTATFPYANFANGSYANGMIQYLTNISPNNAGNGIRWYDGDPTGGSLSPAPSTSSGWVNFAPPLSLASYSIDDNQPVQYYLVGATAIVPYKDRLIFVAPWIQSSGGSPIFLQDTVIYSENGTPYYTASYDNSSAPSYGPQITYNAMLTPNFAPPGSLEETAIPQAYWEDVVGFGGFISSGYAQPIITVGNNEDVLILGFTNRQARFIYTGNDIVPFNFFIINSELGSIATFSGITLDRGILTIGDHGIIITAQTEAARIDLPIPDQVFQITYTNNGATRITAQRDFISEWVYFTYVPESSTYEFPSQTLQYNYRDESWAVFNEAYTTYGSFRQTTGYTWNSIGDSFPTWNSWNEPWSSGATNLLQQKVIAGNAQGFVVFREQGTEESVSLSIQNLNGSTSTVTSPNHCLNSGDYIVISGCLGTIGSQVNGQIFSVSVPTTNTFILNPSITAGTYLGGGLIQRMYVPFIQTKQFPTSWSMARKTRLGAQQYLLTSTTNGQIELQIYLSENANTAYNFGPIVPSNISLNNALVYTDTLFTSPEYYTQACTNVPLGNIGNGALTTITINLFTTLNFANPIVPGSVTINIGFVATFTDNGVGGFTVTGTGVSGGSSINYGTGMVVLVFSVAPTSDPSTISFQYNLAGIQTPTASSQAQIWHRINTSLIGDTIQLGFTMNDTQMRDTTFSNQFSEIELHGFVIDTQPSSLLV
jgi:hypothetical protein